MLVDPDAENQSSKVQTSGSSWFGLMIFWLGVALNVGAILSVSVAFSGAKLSYPVTCFIDLYRGSWTIFVDLLAESFGSLLELLKLSFFSIDMTPPWSDVWTIFTIYGIVLAKDVLREGQARWPRPGYSWRLACVFLAVIFLQRLDESVLGTDTLFDPMARAIVLLCLSVVFYRILSTLQYAYDRSCNETKARDLEAGIWKARGHLMLTYYLQKGPSFLYPAICLVFPLIIWLAEDLPLSSDSMVLLKALAFPLSVMSFAGMHWLMNIGKMRKNPIAGKLTGNYLISRGLLWAPAISVLLILYGVFSHG